MVWWAREARRGFTLVDNKDLYYIIFNEMCDIISCATQLPDKEWSENMHKEYWMSPGMADMPLPISADPPVDALWTDLSVLLQQ